MQEKISLPPKVRSFRQSLVIAGLLVLVDAFLMNQGFISILFGLGLLFIGLSVPPAKYTLLYGHFKYLNSKSNAFLYYTALPPFGRPTYHFSRGSWGYLD
ncbi:MAG: hypothetical protein ACM3N7_11200 [Planctomycetaceae bacterium]